MTEKVTSSMNVMPEGTGPERTEWVTPAVVLLTDGQDAASGGGNRTSDGTTYTTQGDPNQTFS